MAIPYKKIKRSNPANRQDQEKYYPYLVTLGKSVDDDHIVHQLKELSSLSKGDIRSVFTNIFDVIRMNLYNGHSVKIKDFGIFSLSASTEGAETEKECTARNIKSVRINFRTAKSVRPEMNSTRAGEKMTFIDLDTYLKNRYPGNNNGDDEGGFVDPDA